jgi:hypothetical protein
MSSNFFWGTRFVRLSYTATGVSATLTGMSAGRIEIWAMTAEHGRIKRVNTIIVIVLFIVKILWLIVIVTCKATEIISIFTKAPGKLNEIKKIVNG